ncbi:MAG: cation-translocating P-type ATPase [Aquabacterium sp.]|uniref:heavy metal translocating P-type ATPase n=1 Tax=Aquabacterium sp. TaxID=1872578 RepID=UPI001DA56E9E|nr:cation-translocating P-type ATPase [Aquabacterium sp.]MBT9609604.1 cation-translocating P-type ATPase [Aquabacterium sp.]
MTSASPLAAPAAPVASASPSLQAPLPPLPELSPAQAAGLDDPDLLAQCVVDIPLGSSLRRIGLGLSGMYCAACAITIEDALLQVPGVREVQVQATSQRARILVDPAQVSLSAMVSAVQRVGYRAWPDAAARAGHERLRERRVLVWRLSVAAFCMMQVMMIAVPQYVAGPREIPEDIWNLMNWANWVLSLPVLLFSCGPFFTGAWRAARQGRIAMDTPVAIGIAATFIVSTGVSFGAQDVFGHEAYFDSLTMFVTFLLAGRWLESRARERVTQSLEALCVRLPEAVERAVDAVADAELGTVAVASVPLSSLRHGDRVRVAVGQAFPADGLILLGQTEVDEALLTGESRAVPRAPGQTVVAGSLNLGAPVWMSVERLGPDTRYQQIVSLVHQAMTEKPGWMRSADRIAGPFLWGVLALAAGGFVIWQWIDPSRAVWVAVSGLVVTCPCALSLAAPSALLSAAGAMAKRGVLVRRLDALEALATVRQVYFDKTGTLTEGELSVVALVSGGASHRLQETLPEAVAAQWQQAVSLAAHSQHPLSRSVVQAARDAGQAVSPGQWLDVKELAGKGVEAQDAAGLTWRLGRSDWALGPDEGGLDAADAPRVWLAAWRDGQCLPDTTLGLRMDEVFRAEALPAVQQLRALGCSASLLSGDHVDRVHEAARHLGTDVAGAQSSPEDKLAVIAAAQQLGARVAVVGDGINDAPVLAQADVSVALDQGAALAQSQADLIVLNGRLTGLPEAVLQSRRAMRIVRQNLAWAAVYNFGCIPLALMGLLPPWAAGLGMAASSLLVVLNSLRLGATPWKSSTS